MLRLTLGQVWIIITNMGLLDMITGGYDATATLTFDRTSGASYVKRGYIVYPKWPLPNSVK